MQPSGQQTNKMLRDIGSKEYTENQLIREENWFWFFIPPPPKTPGEISISKKQNLVMIFI